MAPDVVGLEPGQRVSCSSLALPRTSSASLADAILIGWTAGPTALSRKLQSLWRDGSLADKAAFPAECVTPLGSASHLDPARLACLKFPAIGYGGLLRGGFRASQSVIVCGATGGLGSSAVLVALALGASRVFAVGRDRAVLDRLTQLDRRRVTPVALEGPAAGYRAQILAAAEGADLAFDALGRVETVDLTRACVEALRPEGTAVWMGGVRADVALPYAAIMRKQITVCGAFMHAPHAPGYLLRLVAAGAVDLSALEPRVYRLAQIDEAIAAAATLEGLQYCGVVP